MKIDIKIVLFVGAIHFFGHTLIAESISSIIDASGYYPYGVSIMAFPFDENDSIITVSASNVTINLNDYIFAQNLTNTVSHFNGIVVSPGLSNVTIKNGTIANLTGTGIAIGDGCTKIILENLTISNCGDVGISAIGTENGITEIAIKNCVITETRATDTWPKGVIIENCNKSLVYDSRVQGLSNEIVWESTGFSFKNVHALEMINCKVLQQTCTQQAIGFMFQECQDAVIKNCISYSNSTTAGDGTDVAMGFLFDQCKRIAASQCQSALNDAATGSSHGFYCKNGERNIFEDCFAQLNNAELIAHGFNLVQEDEFQLVKCTIRSNKSTTDEAAGISLTDCQECYLANNTLVNNKGLTSFGIIDNTNPSTSSIIGNYAFNNGTNYSVTYANDVTLLVVDVSLSNTSLTVLDAGIGTLHNVSITP